MLLSEGQMSDYKGAALMIDAFPKAKVLRGDRGYDAYWFRAAPVGRKIAACIPSKTNRKVPIPHDARPYRQRHKIEIMFGRLKDWRCIHTRYDRCAHPHVRYLHRFNRYLLDQSMCPEPRQAVVASISLSVYKRWAVNHDKQFVLVEAMSRSDPT